MSSPSTPEAQPRDATAAPSPVPGPADSRGATAAHASGSANTPETAAGPRTSSFSSVPGRAAAALGRVAVQTARAGIDEAKASVGQMRGDVLHPPAKRAVLRRVFWGPSLLVAIARAVWRERALRSRYLRMVIPQLALTVVVGLLVVVYWKHVGISASGTTLATRAEHGAKSVASFAVALYGVLSIVEWIVIALVHEHHDAFSFGVAEHIGVPPDGILDKPPRISADPTWLIQTLQRRIRGGMILVVTAVPVVVLAALLVIPVTRFVFNAIDVGTWTNVVSGAIPNVVTFVVGAYWLGVFTLGKSGHAWRDEVVDDPFFLRIFDRAIALLPRALGWLHLYSRLARRVIGVTRRPASVVEHAPWETLGLMLSRVVISVPGIYLALRPLIPIAATVIIVARAPHALKGLPIALVLEERT